jgi:tRNA pseudouridine38-40 synthase
MATYKAIIAYDGTDFEGFQRLGPGHRTVQGEIEGALAKLGWQGTSILAAGRTDAGVHARGQVVSFDLEWRHGIEVLGVALNAHLPVDVGVREVALAGPGFHPRFSARWRRYRYALVAAPQRDPLAERYAWRVWPAPDLEPMHEAAVRIEGEHDFGAFGTPPIPGGHTRREVRLARWTAEGPGVAFEIEANAFLHRMVRRLVSVMVEVGQGRLAASDVGTLLDHPERPWGGKVAPSRGLCLEAVIYDEEGRGANR